MKNCLCKNKNKIGLQIQRNFPEIQMLSHTYRR